MAKKDKLRKYSEIRQFENVYSSKNHYEPMVDHVSKGTFEIRVGDKKIISLVGMARPFKKLKALDIEDLSKKVLAAL